jgi:hypothetical protein
VSPSEPETVEAHECDPKGTTLVTSTYDKKQGWPWRQTKVAYCPICGAIYENGGWYDKRADHPLARPVSASGGAE